MKSEELEQQVRDLMDRLRESGKKFDLLSAAELSADEAHRAQLQQQRATLKLEMQAVPAQVEELERQRLQAILSELSEREDQLREQESQARGAERAALKHRQELVQAVVLAKKAEDAASNAAARLARDVTHMMRQRQDWEKVAPRRPAELRKLVETDLPHAITVYDYLDISAYK